MGFGVFIHRADSIYEDSPAERYHFPKQYLGRVQSCLGNWVIYYEPIKIVDTRGYFAIAKVQKIIPDDSSEGMYFALIEPHSYLDFVRPVPFKIGDSLSELGLLNEEGNISGRAQSAVRPISSQDFNRIISFGFDETEAILPRSNEVSSESQLDEPHTPFQFDEPRQRLVFLSSRAVRNRIFRQVVLRAYDQRCAVTGLKLLNGGGRAEVDAAHIRSVEANGPDIVTNGIALSGTAHWMFDRGLISLSDDLEIMISRQVNDFSAVQSLINKNGRALCPSDPRERPHPHFLQWHREHCFKQ